jgi:hypothetical protein
MCATEPSEPLGISCVSGFSTCSVGDWVTASYVDTVPPAPADPERAVEARCAGVVYARATREHPVDIRPGPTDEAKWLTCVPVKGSAHGHCTSYPNALLSECPVASDTADASCTGPTLITLAGTGTITPGLPCSCVIGVDFQAVVAGRADGALLGCTFDGASAGWETDAGGAGTGVLGGCGLSGTVSYSRTGTLLTLAGMVCFEGDCFGVSSSELAFIPTSASPTTSFALVGTVALTP